VFLAVAIAATPLSAQRDTDVVVLEYNHVHHMLAEQDLVPLLRIYENGLVRVHYPKYMQRAGDYQHSLSPDELVQLFVSLTADGLVDLDLEAAGAERDAVAARRRAGGELHHVSDVTETLILLRPGRVPGFSSGRDSADLQTIRWPNVHSDARFYPGLAPVQSSAAAERRLQEIMDSAVLKGQP